MLFPQVRPWAHARIMGNEENSFLNGSVSFYPMAEGVLLIAQLNGLPDSGSGFFAMHIHEGGNCSGQAFSNAGGHYNPEGKEHPMHAGDLPPLLRRSNGQAYLACITDRFEIEDVIGRTLIIHGGADDFHSQPAGNSGERIGCGVIERN